MAINIELAREREEKHRIKYHALSAAIGIDNILRAVLMITDADTIQKALASGDRSLNTIPLPKWDSLDRYIRPSAYAVGHDCWSLSESVCVAKHVARYHL